MRDVAIVSFAQTPYKRRVRDRSEVEMLLPVVTRAIDESGIPKREIGFTCSGSSDYIAGQAFSTAARRRASAPGAGSLATTS